MSGGYPDEFAGANPRNQTSSTSQQAPVNQNVVLDGTVYSRYNANALIPGPTTPVHMSVVEQEPVFEHTLNHFDIGDDVVSLNINGFTCFNGLGTAGEADKFLENIRFVGFSRQTVMADQSPSGVHDFAVQTGGTLTVKNTGPHTLRAGDWLMIMPPLDESGNVLNVNSIIDPHDEKLGRIPRDRWVGQLVPYKFNVHRLTWNLISQAFMDGNFDGSTAARRAARGIDNFVQDLVNLLNNSERDFLEREEGKEMFLNITFNLFEAFCEAQNADKKWIHAFSLSDAATKQDVDLFVGGLAI